MLLNECSKRFFAILCVQRMCRQRILHTSYDTLNRRTFYEILGLTRNCTAKEVRDAYLQKCKQYHPDATLSTADDSKLKFQEINEAYSILSNEGKRRDYDLTLGSSDYRRTGDLNDFYNRVRKRESTQFTAEELRRRAADVHRQYQQYEQYHREERRYPFETDYERMTREYRRRVEQEWYEERQKRRQQQAYQDAQGEQLFYRIFLLFSFLFLLTLISGAMGDGVDYRRVVEEERKMMEEMEKLENERKRERRS